MKIHKFEEIWLVIGVAILVISMAITGYQAFAQGMAPPSHKETIDPEKVEETAPFDNPGVYEVGNNKYEVVMTLQAFAFEPSEITVPKGAEVTFIMTSKDVIHGVNVPHTNLNTMVVPGQIQRITQTFNESEEFIMICNEYCGTGHQMMSANIKVEE
ncbi:cytochrome c oxidase subunit II [Salinicoccus jeotgali]|uniref:Cytochrome aa3 subunit 2 n=1 Tax=Salinicoccus jeotgali TaxID=381634 RepID=A0ABP7F789_9STAP